MMHENAELQELRHRIITPFLSSMQRWNKISVMKELLVGVTPKKCILHVKICGLEKTCYGPYWEGHN